MKNKKQNVIIKVEAGSIADELGIEPGDILVSINDKLVVDVFDYRYLINDEYIEMCIESADGQQCVAEIEKDEDEDIGIVFESGLMDEAKSCKNKCIFCFIDQLPPNMRETLYFKDDDSRLSFLQGNYVTLTNMSEDDINRIIYYHLSPINVSVHTTDLELRKKMLNNKNADKVLNIMGRLSDAGIEMNLQVVLCRGINDDKILDKTIYDLSRFYPHAKSMSVVPIGLTKYRENLHTMIPFDCESSKKVINQIEYWQNKIKNEFGCRFVYCADEFYIKSGVKIPDSLEYEDFPQIENGVGMISLLEYEFTECFENLEGDNEMERTVSIATGYAAYEFINSLSSRLVVKYPRLKINVYPIENRFFGEQITVSGLLTGKDIINQLEGREIGEYLILPDNLLRSGETVLLDDIKIKNIEEALNTIVRITENTGYKLISTILNTEEI